LRLDEKQYAQNDGPCLISILEMLDEERWGAFPAYAAGSGTRSSLSLPIAAHTHTAGALNLYAAKPDAFATADLAALRSIASQATGAIALAQRITDTQDFVTDLQRALESRGVIDRAIEVIMAQQQCGPDRAFALLRSASQHRNVRLRDVCAQPVARYGDHGDDDPLHPRP
jgi:GAF domain-containing protein